MRLPHGTQHYYKILRNAQKTKNIFGSDDKLQMALCMIEFSRFLLKTARPKWKFEQCCKICPQFNEQHAFCLKLIHNIIVSASGEVCAHTSLNVPCPITNKLYFLLLLFMKLGLLKIRTESIRIRQRQEVRKRKRHCSHWQRGDSSRTAPFQSPCPSSYYRTCKTKCDMMKMLMIIFDMLRFACQDDTSYEKMSARTGLAMIGGGVVHLLGQDFTLGRQIPHRR